MKKIIVILFILLGIVGSAQDGWYYQTPTNVSDVHFTSNNTIIAVGMGVWKSTDRGESWTGFPVGYSLYDPTGATIPLRKVDFYSTLIGYAVGYKGKILKTVNGGESWNLISHNLPEQTTTFTGVSVLDFNSCVAIAHANTGSGYGSVIIKTTDGGSNWFTVYEEASLYLNDIDFPDEQTGWITGNYNKVLKTTDAGSTWTKFELPGTYPLSLSNCLSFKDADNGILSTQSSDYIVRTSDGGANWETISTGISGNSECLQYFTNGTVLMLKDGGAILKSADNGSNWSENSVLPSTSQRRIEYYNTSVGIAYQGATSVSSSNFDYCITSNSGQDWERFPLYAGGIYSFDQNNGWASNNFMESGKQGFLRTYNGETWKFINSTSDFTEVNSYGSFQFLNVDDGFAFANYKTSPTTYSLALVKTTNGGEHWSSLMASSSIMDYYFVNEQYGWVILSNGTILKTLDYGATWGQQNSSASSILSDVYFVDENIGWITGFYGMLLRTTNGGLLWNSISIPGYTDVDFYGIKFFDALTGYMVGRRSGEGLVFKTNDGGITWNDITPIDLTTTYLYGNQFVVKGPSEVYLLDYDNKIFRTGDAGYSWQIINYPSANLSNSSLTVVNSSRMYVQANGILYTKTGGVTSVEEMKDIPVPADFTLYQNYPNPFNPETKIRYSIPAGSESELVNLIIFDLLGKEIKTLLNETQSPGTYEVTFDAGNLSSGVYFYKLKAGKYEESKKMILLR